MARYYESYLKKILSKNGYNYKRTGKGSHEIWYSDITKVTISISRKMGKKLANELLELAPLPDRFD